MMAGNLNGRHVSPRESRMIVRCLQSLRRVCEACEGIEELLKEAEEETEPGEDPPGDERTDDDLA